MTTRLFGFNVLSLPEQVEKNTNDIKKLQDDEIFNPKGEFDLDVLYNKNDLVYTNNTSYFCLQNNTKGVEVTNTEYWQILVSCNADLAPYETIENHNKDIVKLADNIELNVKNIDINKADILKNGANITKNSTDIADLNKLKQDITDNGLKTTIKTIVGAINELFDKPPINPWIVGEYKYFKKDTTVPAGWVKVTAPDNAILKSSTTTYETTAGVFGTDSTDAGRVVASQTKLMLNDNQKNIVEYDFILCDLYIYQP